MSSPWASKLQLAGETTDLPLPWALLHPLPALDHVIPARLSLYTALAAAIILALWLAEASPRSGLKWAIALAGVAASDTESLGRFLGRAAHRPALLQDGRVQGAAARRRDRAGAPIRPPGEQHALAGGARAMHFRMVEGYVSPENPAGVPERSRSSATSDQADAGRTRRPPTGMRGLPDAAQASTTVIVEAGEPGGLVRRARSPQARGSKRLPACRLYRVPES